MKLILEYIKALGVKYIIIMFLVLYVLKLQNCNKNENNENVIKVDTIFTRTIDSIYILDTIYLTTSTVHVDTVYIDNDTLGRYENEVEDELLKGTIISYIDGVLVNQEFNYIAKFPKYIYTIDTVRIEKEKIKAYSRLYIGGELGGNINKFNVSPILGITNRKGNHYYYRYGLIDKTHNIGISTTLYKY